MPRVGKVLTIGERAEWTIRNFSGLEPNDECDNLPLWSPVFSLHGLKWKLTMGIPKFHSVVDGTNAVVSLCMVGGNGTVSVASTWGVKNPSGCIENGEIEIGKLRSDDELWSLLPSTYADLRDRNGGNVILTCSIIISLPPSSEAKPKQGSETSSSSFPVIKTGGQSTQTSKTIGVTKLVEELEELLINGENADVVLKVNGEDFKAHRIILVMRSPVFSAMFHHDTAERRTGVVNIDDCDPKSFPRFLRFVYTGQTEDFNSEEALHLYGAADKYQFPELKEQCLECLKSCITIDNLFDVLVLSLRHDEKELTEKATSFFLDNASEIVVTCKWLEFMTENVTTANELVIKLSRKSC